MPSRFLAPNIPAPRVALALLLGGLLLGLAFLWVGNALTLISNPYNAAIPADDYQQYMVGWPSAFGVKETAQFVQQAAVESKDRPILLIVGGFGRQGSWVLAPLLKNTPNLRVQEGFVETESALAGLVDIARIQRIWILEEPPVYVVPPALLAQVTPAPRVAFTFERKTARIGPMYGSLRILELPAMSRMKSVALAGPTVNADDPPVIESLLNPNGLEGTPAKRFLWVGGGATTLTVRSGKPNVLEISADFRPGPTFAGPMERRVLVRNSDGFEEVHSLPPGPGRIRVPIPAGRSTVQILALDPANLSTNPNGDPRPLIVGFSDFTASFGPSSANPLRSLDSVSCAFEFRSGAYNQEQIGKAGGWFRWSSGELKLRLFSSRAATVELSGQYLVMVRPETIDVMFEDQKIQSIDVGPDQDKIVPFSTMEIKLPAGDSTIVFRASKAGIHPAGDNRSLNFGLANLKMRLKQPDAACAMR